MNLLLALLPIAVYLIILKALDSFTLVRWQRLMLCMAWGMVACGITIGIKNALTPPDGIFPFLEELLKALLVVWMVWKRKILFLAEALCYGAAVGAGFAIVENITYIYYDPDMATMTALLRGMSTALMHMGCTAIVASITYLPQISYLPQIPQISTDILKQRITRKTRKIKNSFNSCNSLKNKQKIRENLCNLWAPQFTFSISALTGLASGMAVHYVYNMFLLTSFVQIAIFVIALLVIFVILSECNERRIYRWMDHSITSDVQLLMAMKEGRLTDTNTGQYLLSVKEQFQPEVFFDIICYMQLYLELVIQGKSRMLLQQEGLDTPLSADEQQRHTDMLRELHTLERHIGIMGKHVLHPIVRFNKEDLAVL